MQLGIVQSDPLHGILQPPVSVQSRLQVDPDSQLVSQLPFLLPLQSKLQSDSLVHCDLQYPAGQVIWHGFEGESQENSQLPWLLPAAPGSSLQAQLAPAQEQVAPGWFGSSVQLKT